MARVTYKLREENGREFPVTGTGATRATAVGEANAKLALTVGEVIGSSVSDILAAGEIGAAHDAGTYSDANIILKRTATGDLKTISLDNIANEYGDGTTGALDITNADLIAFATAYRDSDGNGGYVVTGGEFVK